MNTFHFSSSVDHYLIARAEARSTGATAHDLHSLLSAYVGLVELVEADPSDQACITRLESVETRLRTFCQTGVLRRSGS